MDNIDNIPREFTRDQLFTVLDSIRRGYASFEEEEEERATMLGSPPPSSIFKIRVRGLRKKHTNKKKGKRNTQRRLRRKRRGW